MACYDLSKFFRLSAIINYQLAGGRGCMANLVPLLDPTNSLAAADRALIVRVMTYLRDAYGDSTRRLGPLAILHPIRSAALLARASGRPDPLDLLTALLHDKLEDIDTGKLGSMVPEEVEKRFDHLLKDMAPDREWMLMERLAWLTRREDGQTYFQYMGLLLSHADMTPEVVRVKLADRLDNTLDMRIAVVDPMSNVNFFEHLFQLLYVPSYAGYHTEDPHPVSGALNGAHRLYQLYKNTAMLTMVRQYFSDRSDPVVAKLFDGLARASMMEAERIVLHIFAYHLTDIKEQRALAMSTLDYCQRGGSARIGHPRAKDVMDGFFIERFEHADPKVRRASIAALYDNKALMARAALTLISTFLSFLNDTAFSVAGLSAEGCAPVAAS